jgi:hypothetical protein
MHRVLVVASFAVFAQAGTIQGIVLEHASGRPIARTVVRLDPVPQVSAGGAKGQPLATRAGRTGEFAFPYVGPGLYLLHAVRDGYSEAAYGQRLPTGRDTPIDVTANFKPFAEVRLAMSRCCRCPGSQTTFYLLAVFNARSKFVHGLNCLLRVRCWD